MSRIPRPPVTSVPSTLVVHLSGEPAKAASCLRSVAALDPVAKHETIVIDDASVGLDHLLDHLPAGSRLIRNERRQGLVGCARLGADEANGEVVVLLDGSGELEPPALGPLVAALADAKVAAAAASLPLRPDSHPVCTHALALRREDALNLRATGAEPGFELAAICMEFASTGRRVVTVAGGVARDARPRESSARATLGASPEVTIVIPTLSAAAERVRECVAAVQSRTDVPHQIVLVDNGAPPQGFTAPVNAGLRAVETPYAVVMNDDVEPQSGWWPPLRDALEGGAAVVFPLTEGTWFRTDFSAWCFALSRATLDEMSHAPGEFFDPAFRVWYQDTDLLTRLRAINRPPQLVRDSRVRHGLSKTVESGDPELRAWVDNAIEEDRKAFELKHPSVRVHTDA
jgi:glycosyltransferase involved in cell wall biosynthesis